MSYTENDLAEDLENQEYKYGFVTNLDSETVPKGLSEDTIRLISAKKEEPEWLLDYRLKAYEIWLQMTEPTWAHVHYEKPDFQDIIYYSAVKQKKYESWDDVEPEMKETMKKLGISMDEQKVLTGTNVAVDFVMDSVSVATSFKEKLSELGIIFCSFSEAVKTHPELIKKYMGTVVPTSDNFYAALNSAVFTDGSFCYIPKVFAVRWNFPRISESMKKERANSKEHWWWPIKVPMFPTWKDALHQCVMKTNYMRQSWN